MMAPRSIVVFAVCLLLAGASLFASAQGGMRDMAGMHMGGEIFIPKGARYTKADVEFMQGMIAHHAQAIVMSRMAEAHGASPQVLKLSTKIDQSQVPEISIMQKWLVARSASCDACSPSSSRNRAPRKVADEEVLTEGRVEPAQTLKAARVGDVRDGHARVGQQVRRGTETLRDCEAER